MAYKDRNGRSLTLFRHYQSPLIIQRQASPMVCGDNDGRMFLSCFFLRLLQSPFAIWRQSSLMACRDEHSHLLPLSRDSMSVDQSYWSLPCYPETSESHSIRRSSRLSILLLSRHQSFCWCTWCLLCSFFWQVLLIEKMVGQVEILLEGN